MVQLATGRSSTNIALFLFIIIIVIIIIIIIIIYATLSVKMYIRSIS